MERSDGVDCSGNSIDGDDRWNCLCGTKIFGGGGGKYAGMPLNPQADELELSRWLEVNNMGGFPYWAKKGEGTMWKRWMDEQQALWSRGTPGQGYNTWRREKIAAGVWVYDDE